MRSSRSSEYAAGRVTPDRPNPPAGESPHLICGLHPALAEHTLQRLLDANGGFGGTLDFLERIGA